MGGSRGSHNLHWGGLHNLSSALESASQIGLSSPQMIRSVYTDEKGDDVVKLQPTLYFGDDPWVKVKNVKGNKVRNTASYISLRRAWHLYDLETTFRGTV